MTIKDFQAVAGSHLSDKDARTIGPVLTQLAAKGKSDVRAIVAEAQKPTSPLHPYFEWDDAAAATAYRMKTATKIAQSILVTVVMRDGTEQSTRAFLPVYVDIAGRRSRSRHYLPIEVVQKTPDYASQAITEARRQLKAWVTRYREYEAAFGVLFPLLDEVLAEPEEVAA